MDSINSRIAQIVELSGLTKTEFAQKINVSQSYVSKLCAGNALPARRTIEDIARVFKINPYWLETGQGAMIIEQTRADELSAFFGSLACDPDGSFRAAFIAELAKLDLESWQALEGFCRRVLDRDGKKKED